MSRPRPTNVVVIFADDLGYGDLSCYNPTSRIPTPNLDRIAASGCRFTDAHAGSAVCTPSRYTLLTGRHPSRSRLDGVVLWPWDGPVIEEGLPTLAGHLREHGYRTTCIGKWHLGWDWPTTDGRHPNETLPYARKCPERDTYGQRVDFRARITGGPVDRGFEHYFGVDVPNFPPYAWFEDDRLTEEPTATKPADMFGLPGEMAPGWELEAVIPELTRRAVTEIEVAAKSERPLFLFLSLTSPHSPIAPNERFIGSSDIGPYGDFVVELDDVVGQVVAALEREGLAQDTLLFFSSDNGPEGPSADDVGAYQRLLDTGHASMGDLRGIKRDGWEGGHRVPLLAMWPGVVRPDSVCEHSVSLGDIFATCAELIGTPLPPEASDSTSLLSLLRGESDRPPREFVVSRTARNADVIKAGDWVYVDGLPENSPEPEAVRELRGLTPTGDATVALYDLAADPGQARNLLESEPDRAAELKALLEGFRTEPSLQFAARER